MQRLKGVFHVFLVPCTEMQDWPQSGLAVPKLLLYFSCPSWLFNKESGILAVIESSDFIHLLTS